MERYSSLKPRRVPSRHSWWVAVEEWSVSSLRGTRPRRPSAALSPERSDNTDSLCALTAHSQFEYGSTAWNSLWSSALPWMVMPSGFMSVQSTASVSPGLTSWVKNTSFSGPSLSRQAFTRRWKVRKSPGLISSCRPAVRCSKSALASSSGACRSISSACGQRASSGSSRVRQVCGTRCCSVTLFWRKYLRAVLRDMPDFIALMLMVFPWLRSMASLVSWVRVTTTRSGTRRPATRQPA